MLRAHWVYSCSFKEAAAISYVRLRELDLVRDYMLRQRTQVLSAAKVAVSADCEQMLTLIAKSEATLE